MQKAGEVLRRKRGVADLCQGGLLGLKLHDLLLKLRDLLLQPAALPLPLPDLLVDVAIALGHGLEGLRLALLALQHLFRGFSRIRA